MEGETHRLRLLNLLEAALMIKVAAKASAIGEDSESVENVQLEVLQGHLQEVYEASVSSPDQAILRCLHLLKRIRDGYSEVEGAEKDLGQDSLGQPG